MDCEYLSFDWDWGFGEGDLRKIEVIGETIEASRKQYKIAPQFLRTRRQESKWSYREELTKS
ncbi:MAG: hypothetical protein HWN71_08900 [Desulfobacterales bacterium]|nr:hypothetical protein [Desulfobacterales bacterium]